MRTCNKCGAELEKDQVFCTSCGSKIVNERSNITTNENVNESKNVKGNDKKSKTNKIVLIVIAVIVSVSVVIVGTIFGTVTIFKMKADKEASVASDSSLEESKDRKESDKDKDKDDNVSTDKDDDVSIDKENTNINNSVNEKTYFIDKYSNIDFIIPISNTVELGFKDLNYFDSEQLIIARNEMKARYGYVFKNQPNLQDYFESKSWYKPNYNYSGVLTSKEEIHNEQIIKSIEFLKNATEERKLVANSTNGSYLNTGKDFILATSNSRELVNSDVSGLNDWEIVIARNEIFARYGLAFSTEELITYFKTKSWFKVDPSLGNDMKLNEIENKNVAIILAEEERRIEAMIQKDLTK